VRKEGDREAWLAFFLEGVRLTAQWAVGTAQQLGEMFRNDRIRIERETGQKRRAGSAIRVHEALEARPIRSLPETSRITGLSFPTVSSAMRLLTDTGITRELTGRRRDRVFVYEGHLALLNQGSARP